MKGVLVFVISALLILTSFGSAYAGTRIEIYFAGGLIVGGLSVLWSFSIKTEVRNNQDMFALNSIKKEITPEAIEDAAMIKILRW